MIAQKPLFYKSKIVEKIGYILKGFGADIGLAGFLDYNILNMKTLIIYMSLGGNTKNIAQAMADAIGADIINSQDVDADNISQYELIGFGSGIYAGKHHQDLFDLMPKLKINQNAQAFIFSTSGAPENEMEKNHLALKKAIALKGMKLAGEFNCPGQGSWGIFKFIGFNKNRPNQQDIQNAKEFIKKINK